MPRQLVIIPAMLIHSVAVAAQPVTPRPLAAASAELAEPFSSVAGLRELSDGRIVLLDSRERALWITDPGLRSASRVGREGQGPQEYLRPSGLVALPGDTTWIVDGGNNRNLVMAPSGALIGTTGQITIKPSEGVTYSSTARGTDAQGNVYMALPFGLIDRGPNDKGDTPILRYGRAANRFDTVATFNDPTRIRIGPPAQQMSVPGGGGARMGFTASTLPAYAGKDDWAPAPDGAIALVRWEPYRVEWRDREGRLVQGSAIEYAKVRVGDAEKKEFLDALRARGGGSMTTTTNGRSQTVQMPVPEPETWAEFKPPFVVGTAISAPDNTLWVQRSTTAAAKDATWDVFDRSGRIVRQVVMPKRSRVVGFGKDVVYVARVDDDDLMYIGRYPMPR
jgi:hypothetical protein